MITFLSGVLTYSSNYPTTQSFFGYATSSDGDYAIVGAHRGFCPHQIFILHVTWSSFITVFLLSLLFLADLISGVQYTHMGSAYIYQYSSGTNSWSQIGGTLQPVSAKASYLGFGCSAALHNGVAVVGQTSLFQTICSSNCPTYESVQVYSISGSTVSYTQTLLAPTASIGFGMSVAVNDNYILVGAPNASKSYYCYQYIVMYTETFRFVLYSTYFLMLHIQYIYIIYHAS